MLDYKPIARGWLMLWITVNCLVERLGVTGIYALIPLWTLMVREYPQLYGSFALRAKPPYNLWSIMLPQATEC